MYGFKRCDNIFSHPEFIRGNRRLSLQIERKKQKHNTKSKVKAVTREVEKDQKSPKTSTDIHVARASFVGHHISDNDATYYLSSNFPRRHSLMSDSGRRFSITQLMAADLIQRGDFHSSGDQDVKQNDVFYCGMNNNYSVLDTCDSSTTEDSPLSWLDICLTPRTIEEMMLDGNDCNMDSLHGLRRRNNSHLTTAATCLLEVWCNVVQDQDHTKSNMGKHGQ